jgi:hypothetical protein
MNYEAAYGFNMLGGFMELNGFVRTDPGHIEAMQTDVGGAFRFTVRQ